MASDNYAVDAVVRLNEIGFEEFTANLITSTFDAIIQSNLDQTESYLELVRELTKSLKTFINETKLEIPGEEVLGYIAALPAFKTADGQPIVNQASSASEKPEITLTEGESVSATSLNDLNNMFTSGNLVSQILSSENLPDVTSLLKDGLGLVGDLLKDATDDTKSQVFPVPGEPDFYDPGALNSYVDSQNPDPVAISDAAIAKLYDSVSELIAGNKYALLQEMVKLGTLRTIVYDGIIRSELSFKTYERLHQSSVQFEKHQTKVKEKYRQKQPRSRGILALIRGRESTRTKRKSRELHVSTSSDNSSAAYGTDIMIKGLVELRFKTDYMPVSQA